MSAATKQYSATGRRKTSVARVTLVPGTGMMTVNGRSCEEYFPTVSLQNTVSSPLLLVSGQRFDIDVNTSGGGVNGQVGAVRLGIARALLQYDPELRPSLKDKGYLTRDPRMKERKKPGRPGARKRFQFSKR